MNTEPESPQPASAYLAEALASIAPQERAAGGLIARAAPVNETTARIYRDPVRVYCDDRRRKQWHHDGRRHWLAEFMRESSGGWQSIPHVTSREVARSTFTNHPAQARRAAHQRAIRNTIRLGPNATPEAIAEYEATITVHEALSSAFDPLDPEAAPRSRASLRAALHSESVRPGEPGVTGAELLADGWHIPPCKCGREIAPIRPAVLAPILDTLADNGLTSISLEMLARLAR